MNEIKIKSFPAYSDEDLLKQIASGDRNAFSMLYDRYSPLLYGLAIKILRDPVIAADVIQDVFLNIWKNAISYSLKRGKAIAWMSFICRNRCIDMLRVKSANKRKSLPLNESKVEELQNNISTNPSQETHLALMTEIVKRAITRLPEEQRIIVEMAYYQGFTQAEISEKLNIPIGTVKTRMRNGMNKLKNQLKSKLGNEI